MRLFKIDDLRALAERRQWPCISLYLPTHRAGRKETQEDPIRLRNAVGRAKEQLLEAGYAKDAAAGLLEPAGDLVTSRDFWLQRADGLALFLAPEWFQYYRVPLKLQDEVVVADLNLDEIEEIRQSWAFFRDRRPESYGDLVKQLP